MGSARTIQTVGNGQIVRALFQADT